MEKQRKIKILSIIALIFAIAGITLGFAAFSTTLNISSSATITPSADGIILNLYGNIGSDIIDAANPNNYTNTSYSNIVIEDSAKNISLYNKKAEINNSSLSINTGEIEISEPGTTALTIVKIKNEGYYDVYIDSSKFPTAESGGECIPQAETTAELVEKACPFIYRDFRGYNYQGLVATVEYYYGELQTDEYISIIEQSNFCQKNGICKLSKGEEMYLTIAVGYSYYRNSNREDITPRADGPFSVIFPDFKLEYTINSAGYSEE